MIKDEFDENESMTYDRRPSPMFVFVSCLEPAKPLASEIIEGFATQNHRMSDSRGLDCWHWITKRRRKEVTSEA